MYALSSSFHSISSISTSSYDMVEYDGFCVSPEIEIVVSCEARVLQGLQFRKETEFMKGGRFVFTNWSPNFVVLVFGHQCL